MNSNRFNRRKFLIASSVTAAAVFSSPLVTIAAEKPALCCWLDLDGADARCSDYFIQLGMGESKRILVRPTATMTAEEFTKALRVRSLFDTYPYA